MVLVGINGLAQSGKNTAGNYLVETLGFTAYAFGDKLKHMVMDLYGLTHDQCFTDVGKREYLPKYGMTVRKLLQLFGTEGCRAIYGPIWCDYVMRQIDPHPDGLFVITDVRFDDEASAIRERGGVLVKVSRVDHRELQGKEAAHKSERMAIEYPDSYFDHVIKAKTGELGVIRDSINKFVLGKFQL